MAEHVLFLTGRLAYPSLCRVLEEMAHGEFSYHVHDLGLSVAGLMTADMIQRRLEDSMDADRILVPGLCSGALEALSEKFGVPVVKGPKDLKDLPEFFGAKGTPTDLSVYSVRIFAEIVEAPNLSVEEIISQADAYRESGADVVDLGCLPGVDFPHMEDAVQALSERGFLVSVDSLEVDDLIRAGHAGADYLLSLKESTLWVADEVPSVPVLIPEQAGDQESLYRASITLAERRRDFFADPILDPIHFGFTESLLRYHALRRRLPDVDIMMGTGNVTELTDGDTTGITALLMGVASELDVSAILTTQVSGHARTAVREADVGRRMMHAAKRDSSLPRGIHDGLMALRSRKPFPYSPDEVAETARAIKDPSFRIQISEQGIHVYNRDGMHTADNPFALFPDLNLEGDGAHAFYMGVELARAQVAWQLGKRYTQDQQLNWGCLVPEEEQTEGDRAPGTTLESRSRK